MVSCYSFQKKLGSERCSLKPLYGSLYCKRHSSQINPRNWFYENNRIEKIIKIQKVWRGFFIRYWLKLAGPGVLNRKICSNDEELFTLDNRNSVNPLWYFSFKENNNIWWFDIRSIWESTLVKNIPLNPYNRIPLSIETRIRLRKLAYLHLRKSHNLHHDDTIDFTIQQKSLRYWRQIIQILEENGFYELDPLLFNSMNPTQYFIFLSMLYDDMKVWYNEHGSHESRRNRYIVWTNVVSSQIYNIIDNSYVSLIVSKLLLSILNDCLQNYPMCFMIMSSFYRL
jgi:hypothetical protein